MRKLVALGLAATLGVGAAAPAAASWDVPVCTVGTLDVCVNFHLAATGTNQWGLTATVSGVDAGLLKAVGLYANPALNPTPVYVGSTPSGWTFGDQGLSGPFASTVFEVGATDDPGVSPSVTITFTTTQDLAAIQNTALSARAHVGSIGTSSCSLKFGTEGGAAGTVVYATDGSECSGGGGTDSTVPEPVSLILLGSGLLGIGGLRIRRRK